jgi:hypothetical protein
VGVRIFSARSLRSASMRSNRLNSTARTSGSRSAKARRRSPGCSPAHTRRFDAEGGTTLSLLACISLTSEIAGAQPGSAPRSGRGGRRFKSYHSDQYLAEIPTSTGTGCGTVSSDVWRSSDQPPRPDVTLMAELSGHGSCQADREPSRLRCEPWSLWHWREVGRCPQGR